MTVYANVGSVSVQRVVATAAVVAVATAGMFTAFARPRKTYLALTSHRLRFFDGETMSGRPGKLLFTLPRQAVSVAGVDKGAIAVKVELAVLGQDKGLRLTFPTVARKDGEQLAALLRGPRRRLSTRSAVEQLSGLTAKLLYGNIQMWETIMGTPPSKGEVPLRSRLSCGGSTGWMSRARSWKWSSGRTA